MNRLTSIAKKHTRIVVGLMSGTSHDGVDAVVARIKGAGAGCTVELITHSYTPYPDKLGSEVGKAFDGPTSLVCSLNFELGEFFAAAALGAVKEAGLKIEDVDLIGSHGQTIYHVPPGATGGGAGKAGSTLQIGEGAVIARRTGAVTINDFRTADMAAGGHGAPLVPLADWVMFRRPGKVTALQNIGGIANVTVVTEDLDGVMGFDTGPGNSLIDETVRILTRGRIKYDKGGKLAASGEIIPKLMQKLVANPYFKKKPPKSTGRETFGKALAEKIVAEHRAARKEDILCTLTHLSAMSIRAAYDDFVFPAHGKLDRIALCGGGAGNDFLVSLLRRLFEGIPVIDIEELGVPAQAREALCFAVLANETMSGNPGNVPSVTGAGSGAILGKINL